MYIVTAHVSDAVYTWILLGYLDISKFARSI